NAYNLIATRQWMLVVPRSQESYQEISVNSLGFAGSLLVRNIEQMQLLKDIGPMNLLKSVALPID
ncbi:MAG: phosphorylase, partial [Pseudanabaenales cyanobacterium]|nr:phosphorylase [Pseudanabaenales cyanobacterium]MCG8368371.1 phosphorylase [Pseudanabaenales cyanobacterium]